ncbi:ABC transporter related protein [Pirellula staleyi DSM 6068]|uniref:ABC transporter related protein n=1 Tax=Pirellula staleyi (strain ATCC 27377 / DSM 6068 / ICPB 4128) TaxID=530564 RepID=D2R7B6_PIRSD|nr:ABC transporter ATP-binding protein [Pirellula staleyi]ADB15612.1 ABC transporter related protein [Pirellula staleyi DSM 6068]
MGPGTTSNTIASSELPASSKGTPEKTAVASASERAIPKLSITAPRRDDDREPDKRPLDLRLITRLLSYTRPYAFKRNVLFVCVFLRAFQLPAIAWTIGAVIEGPIAGHAEFSSILAGALGLLLLAGSTQVVFHFRQRLALELGEAVIHDLRNAIFAHLQRMPMSFFSKTKIGRIISRVTSDCEALRVGVQDVLFVTLVGVGQMMVAASVMLYYDWAMFSVVAAISPVLWVVNQYFRKQLSGAYRVVQESFSRLTATLAESIAGIRVTQGFVREELNTKLFRDLLAWHGENVVKAARMEGRLLPLLELSSQSFIVALLLIGGYRVLDPDIAKPAGELIYFFFLANIFFSPIQILGNQYNQALTAMAGAERVFALLDEKPEWEDAPDAHDLPPLAGKVEFQGVSFGYDPARPVLHDIDFTAEPGQSIALVGRTGSGKSSIINLIARFYRPQSGDVKFDGHSTREITGDSLHHQMGIVLQQNFLFTGTIRENIRLGRPSATDEEVRQALVDLDCIDLMESLPSGLDTQVGERGAQLSLGQRQLVCFARAMVAQPRILILDEATSSIDTLTELRIQRSLAKLLAGRTSFVVAHRLSTIRDASLVLVLEQGKIIERGTHDQLVAKRGEYASLLAQFARGAQIVEALHIERNQPTMLESATTHVEGPLPQEVQTAGSPPATIAPSVTPAAMTEPSDANPSA